MGSQGASLNFNPTFLSIWPLCLQHLICKMMARNGAELAQPLVKMNEYSAQHLADISETVDETNNQTPLTD